MKPMVTLRKHQEGAVAIMVGLTIFVLIAFLGMTVDLGRLFITKTELSNAADACALAAAAELLGDADALNRAESAGITVGQRNKVGFQGSAVVVLPNSDVTFSDHLNGTYLTKTAVAAGDIDKMKYAKCTLPQTGILPYFMQVVGLDQPRDVRSHAIATLAPGITNCGLPIAICKNKTPPPKCKDGSAPDAMGLCKNEWVCSKFTTPNSPGGCSVPGSTGNFNWIDYNPGEPTEGCSGGGASELACIIEGTGQCTLNYDTEVGQTGNIQSLAKAWNTRFGLYKGNSGIPDFSGFSYTPTSWPSQYGAFDGTQYSGAPSNNDAPHLANLTGDTTATSARKGNWIYQNETGTWPDGPVIDPNGYQNSTSAELAASGADRRLAVVPVVDCGTDTSVPPDGVIDIGGWHDSQTVPIIKFACIMMLHPMDDPKDPLYLEYQGLSDDPGNPCGTIGMPGGPASVGPQVPTLVR